jgi:hypothetical protein
LLFDVYDAVVSFSEGNVGEVLLGNGKYLCDRSRLWVRLDVEVQDSRPGIRRVQDKMLSDPGNSE